MWFSNKFCLPISTQKDVRGYQKVTPGKMNHKNDIKSCQIVLFSSKSGTEGPSSDTVVCWFYKHSYTEQKNANFCHSMLLKYLLTQAKRFMNFFKVSKKIKKKKEKREGVKVAFI